MPEENGNGKKTEHRLTVLEATVQSFEKRISQVCDNHIPHLQETMNKMQISFVELKTVVGSLRKIVWGAIIVFVIGTLSTVGTAIILEKMFK
jgi:hypothetical protein